MNQKITKVLASAGVVTLLATTSVPLVNATTTASATSTTTSSSSSSTTTLAHAYIVYGAGVSASLYSRINQVLGVDSSFIKLTSTASDYHKYINHSDNTTDAAMISSVAIAPTDPGSGVKVNIKKYDGAQNITSVTAQQYALVAQMAGVSDVTIEVTANRAVSGQAALAGVYKALATAGISLNAKNTQSANKMLKATSTAITAQKQNASYAKKLLTAIGNTTKKIAQNKQNNQTMTTSEIKQLLITNLKEENVYTNTSTTNITNITNALVSFQNSPIASSSKYTTNISNTVKNIEQTTGNVMNTAKNWANSSAVKSAASQASKTATSWWDKLVAWIKSIF